jgi:hypothetical protein
MKDLSRQEPPAHPVRKELKPNQTADGHRKTDRNQSDLFRQGASDERGWPPNSPDTALKRH